MTVVCGIDVGSLRTLSYVAWLADGQFELDVYVPSEHRPLPKEPAGWEPASHFAIDAPQGMPALGAHCRLADTEANTPTRRLPNDREHLAIWKLYRGVVEAGVEMFWAMHERRLASIYGLGETAAAPVAMESYPRLVIKRMWPGIEIPSKRTSPFTYIDRIWGLIRERGYACRSVVRPTVDQVDAMLCALAAEAASRGEHIAVGSPPVVDANARVIREGYIVAPRGSAAAS